MRAPRTPADPAQETGGIVDAHVHLGDILQRGGARLIHEKGVRKARVLDPVTLSEWLLHPAVRKVNYDGWIYRLAVRADHARNRTATLENLASARVRADVTRCAVMPIPPNVTFQDLLPAARLEPWIVPFTGVDFTRIRTVDSDLARDVEGGARGLKLHPILQNVALDDERTFQAVEAFGRYGLPVLFHAGIAHYYLDEADRRKTRPEYGRIRQALGLVKAFPRVPFVVGHAGLVQAPEVMEALGGFRNVWVEVSIQGPGRIRKLVDTFGPDRVLNGSDWPWGRMHTSIRAVRRACRGDGPLERRILYENAAELLKL